MSQLKLPIQPWVLWQNAMTDTDGFHSITTQSEFVITKPVNKLAIYKYPGWILLHYHEYFSGLSSCGNMKVSKYFHQEPIKMFKCIYI